MSKPEEVHQQEPIGNIILNGGKLNALSLRLGTRQGYLLSLLVVEVMPAALPNAIRQEK